MLSNLFYKLLEAQRICRAFSTQFAGLKAANSSEGVLNSLDSEHFYRSRSHTTRDSQLHKTARDIVRGITLERPSSAAEQVRQTLQQVDKAGRAKDLERLQTRRWKQGDVYAPHDLSPVEMQKWRNTQRPSVDVFDILAINPLNEWKNYSMMSEYMTSMGRIQHSKNTGLRKVNQRKIAKAIKRAVGMGFMPSVHKHPEMLRRDRR